MRLPGSRYQEYGWEKVRKFLAQLSLPLLQSQDAQQLLALGREAEQLDWYAQAMALAMHPLRDSARAQQAGNSYGETVLELAQGLVCELRALPQFWLAFLQALRADGHSEAAWRKKINDLYASLRDRVDADNYQVASGLPCSPNKIYTWRMLDTAAHEVARILANWPAQSAQIEAILGRACPVMPIEAVRMRQTEQILSHCRAEWIIRWSATLHEFAGKAGPLHTRSKRFASLKNQPEKIAAMLQQLHDYQNISGLCPELEFDYQQDVQWLEDLARVQEQALGQEGGQGGSADAAEDEDVVAAVRQMQEGWLQEEQEFGEAEEGAEGEWTPGSAVLEDAEGQAEQEDGQCDELEEGRRISLQAQFGARLALPGLLQVDHGFPALNPESERALCEAISLPPDYLQAAAQSEDKDSLCYRILAAESLPLRLAVYLHLLGADDDSYPDSWRDPRSGQLPSCKQLAALAQISLPTLRKRRAAACARLQEYLGVPLPQMNEE